MADSSGADNASDADFFAYGLLVCVLTICVSYIVRRAWPRRHYPKFFAFLAAVATVSGLYILKVPGAGFGLGALAVLGYLALHMPESIETLFDNAEDAKLNSLRAEPVSSTPELTVRHLIWPIIFGTLIGIVITASVVAAVVMPPSSFVQWVKSSEPLHERVDRALNPSQQWTALSAKEREASERIRQSTAQMADMQNRLTDAEAKLEKAQDELGLTSTNTIKEIRISENSGSRHANGAVYIGVEQAVPNGNFCAVRVSSDNVSNISKNLHVGEAIPIDALKNKFRVILIGLDSKSCVFDLVKD